MEVSPRECAKSPAGKALMIPVMQVEKSDKEAPGSSVLDLDKSAKKDQNSVNSLYLQIGDKVYNYNDLVKYRTHIDAFNVVFPNNAIYGVIKGGPSKAVADGFYIITKPLAKGTIQSTLNQVYFVKKQIVQNLTLLRILNIP
jgi:hypothetical protein